MRPYETIIMEQLQGGTPKEKFENLTAMQNLLQKIAFPRRGSLEEKWTIDYIAESAALLIDYDKDYKF